MVLSYTASIVGPGIAGVLIDVVGLGSVYVIDAISFVAVLVALFLMRYRRAAEAPRVGFDWRALVEGLRFTYETKLVWSTMLLDFFATLFSSARTMLPLVAQDVLGVGARGYGILATAQPFGALAAGVFLSFRSNIRRQGVVLLVSVAVYGVATALFGLSTVFWLSYILFALTGAGDTVSTVIRGTMRQLITPDRLRGRMTSFNMIFFAGGPQLGEFEAGLVASVLGVPFAIFSGGVATLLLTIGVAWRYPRLRHYMGDEGRAMARS
jgi:MFS family permease